MLVSEYMYVTSGPLRVKTTKLIGTLIIFILAEQNEAELSFLLDVVESDEPAIRSVSMQYKWPAV